MYGFSLVPLVPRVLRMNLCPRGLAIEGLLVYRRSHLGSEALGLVPSEKEGLCHGMT